MTFRQVIGENPGKSKIDCLDILIKFFQKLHRGLYDESTVDTELRGQLEKAVLTEPDCKWAICQGSTTFEGLVGDLRKGFGVDNAMEKASMQALPPRQQHDDHQKKRYDAFLQAYEGVPTPTEISDDEDEDDHIAHHAYETVNDTAFMSFQPAEVHLTYTNCFVATSILDDASVDDAPAPSHSAEALLLHSLRDNAFNLGLARVLSDDLPKCHGTPLNAIGR
ncbi:hypothetical protein E4U50_007904 [Claviceps purpurea]|nr:hypothetical protein E4U50_007904 [Claviceps purpurea]